MKAGRLNRRVTLERPTETIGPSGAPETEWQALATVWAERRDQSTDEFLAEFGAGAKAAAVFRIRYGPAVTIGDRVRHGEDVLPIVGTKEIGRREGLELRCEGAAA